MANYNNLLTTINGAIKTNGEGFITGQRLQTILDGMVASLGARYQYAGVATPATNPGTPDENVFYLATQAGTYTNFGGLVVNDGEVCALKWDGTWAKDVTGAATAEQVIQLGQEIDKKESALIGVDTTITETQSSATKMCILDLANLVTPEKATIEIEVTTGDSTHYHINALKNGAEVSLASSRQGNTTILKMDDGYSQIYLYPYDGALTASVHYTIAGGRVTDLENSADWRGAKTDPICGAVVVMESQVNNPNCIFPIGKYHFPAGTKIHIKVTADAGATYNVSYFVGATETRIVNGTGNGEYDTVLAQNVDKFLFYVYSGNPIATIEYTMIGQFEDVQTNSEMLESEQIVICTGFAQTRDNGITMTDGGYIRPTTGVIVSDSAFKYSDFVKVVGGASYSLHSGGQMFNTNQGITFYDKSKNVIGSYTTGTNDYDRTFTTPDDCAYIRFSAYKVSTDERLTYNGESYSPFKAEVQERLSEIENSIDSQVTDLVLPEKLYLNGVVPTTIFLLSMLPKYLRDSMVYVKNNTTSPDKLFTEVDGYCVKIKDPADVNEGTMGLIVGGKLYGNNEIPIVHGDTQTQRTIRYILFGDSTSAEFMPSKILSNLTARGITNITLTPNGTEGTGYDKTEARRGWMYAQYIGYRTVLYDGTPISNFPSFLKLATATDKSNHPDWCYTRTFSANEKTYAEVAAEGGDLTQDFYIFDFSHYLSANGFDTPDAVMIQMSINDLWIYGFNADTYARCVKAITIMASQIKAVSANIKIVISPSPITVNNNERFDWYRICKQACSNLEIDYHPVYMYQSTFMLPLQDNNGQLVPYDVHTTAEGYMAAGQAWANYLLTI